MQVQHGAHVVLPGVHHLLVVGVGQKGQHGPVRAQRGLNHIGDVALGHALLLIDHVLAGELLVLREVVVGTVCHAPQLAPAEGEQILKVRRRFGIEGQLLRLMVPQPQILVVHPKAQQPVVAEAAPVLKPGKVGARLAEELQLHLLELQNAEGEVARGDLVAEALAHLADAEGNLFAGGALDALIVHEDALGGLGTEVHVGAGLGGDALMGLEHQVELLDVGKIALAAARAGNALFPDIGHHLIVLHGLHVHVGAGLLGPVLDELVGAVAPLAALAVDEGVIEVGHMAAGLPHPGIHQDAGVQTHVQRALLYELLPPGLLHVVLHEHAQGAIVPGVGKSSVDLAAGEYEASVFAQGHQLFHCLFALKHFLSSFPAYGFMRRDFYIPLMQSQETMV